MSEEREEEELDAERARRLLAHITLVNTRWWKVSAALLNFGRRGVPEERNSYNPVKWAAAEIGLWMDQVQMNEVNRKLEEDKDWWPGD